MKIHIFYPGFSHGLRVDAQIVRTALAGSARGSALQVAMFSVGRSMYQANKAQSPPMVAMPQHADVAIFIERMFEHPALDRYRHRILLANPEWLTSRTADLAKATITDIWHKSRFSMRQLRGHFPKARHALTGFTSFDPGRRVADHETFCHFRGKSIHRNSQQLLDLWFRHPQWPRLNFQAYDTAPGFISTPEWLHHRNIDLRLGFMAQEEYAGAIGQAGIHLCTSETEGFGHYINEARALGALAVVLDAPPMNELIDAECGVVVPTTGEVSQNFGVRFGTTVENLQSAIERVLQLPAREKARLGANARERYVLEAKAFMGRMSGIVDELAEMPGA